MPHTAATIGHSVVRLSRRLAIRTLLDVSAFHGSVPRAAQTFHETPPDAPPRPRRSAQRVL